MRVGRSLDELGHSMSWLDLWAFVKYSRVALGEQSVIGHVMENPPVDPASVPRAAELLSVSDRIAEARRLAAGQETTARKRVRKSA